MSRCLPRVGSDLRRRTKRGRSRVSLLEVRVDYIDRVIKDRNGKEITLKRVGYVDRSRYPGPEARRLRGVLGVGQRRRVDGNF